MKMSWFRKLRERQKQKAIEKARQQGIELASKRAGILARIELLNEALTVAESSGDEALLRDVCAAANRALAELDELNREGIADVARGFDLTRGIGEEN
jgi:hypothetical protein